jgi:hypothetical protein
MHVYTAVFKEKTGNVLHVFDVDKDASNVVP